MPRAFIFTSCCRAFAALCLSATAASCVGDGGGEPSEPLGEGAQAVTASGNLPGGTSISVSVDDPLNGAVLPAGPVGFDCTGEVGNGLPVANTQITYVLDVSGSTNSTNGCGGDQNGDGLSNTVIDCEIAAARTTNSEAISTGTVGEVGVAIFGTNGAPADVGPAGGTQLITGPATDASGNGQPDVDDVLGTANASGGSVSLFSNVTVGSGSTNFGAGMSAAAAVAAAATKPNKIVVFVSDGQANAGPAVNTVPLPPGVVFYTFAIGAGSSCTANPTGRGSLQDIANRTGGTCTDVPDVAQLPNIIPGVIASQLTGLSVTVDGSPVAVTLSQSLPENGPTTVTCNGTTPSLAPGSHTICAIADGSDGGGTGSVTDCHTILINSPPVAQCKSVGLSAGPQCNADVSIDDGSFDPDTGDSITCVQSPPSPYSLGTTSVTLTCTDSHGAVSTCTGFVTVDDTTPPVITCPASQTQECTAGSAVATFPPPLASDNCGPVSSACVPASGSSFPLGTSTDTCTATDGTGNTSTCTFNVSVIDTLPPVVTIGAAAPSLWPPNHKYRDFSLSDCVASVVDQCHGTLDINAVGTITRIESDEPEDANGSSDPNGDGKTCDDTEIVDGSHARLRAERDGTGDGRVYTVFFDVSDPNTTSPNVTHTSCQVVVPHDMSGAPAVGGSCASCSGDGCGACPTSSLLCP